MRCPACRLRGLETGLIISLNAGILVPVSGHPSGTADRCLFGRPPTCAAEDKKVRPLLACATVDGLTQQIGVPNVAGVLLDEMNDDVAGLDLPPVDLDQRVEIQIGIDRPGMGDFSAPGAPGFGNDLVLRHRLIEIKIRVFLGSIQTWQFTLLLEDPACPGVLDPSEMTDQPQQRHRRRRDRARRKLRGGQSFALELEGHPIAVKVLREHSLFAPSRRNCLAGVIAGLGPHAIEAHPFNQATEPPSKQGISCSGPALRSTYVARDLISPEARHRTARIQSLVRELDVVDHARGFRDGQAIILDD